MIDKNRGCIRKSTPSGLIVYMYKDEPGVYLDAKGNPINEEVAAAARFDIVRGKREKRRLELYAEARRRADEQVAREFRKADEQLHEEEGASGAKVGAEETDEPALAYRPEKRGQKWVVLDPEDNAVAEGLGKREAEVTAEEMSQAGASAA